ncbi:MAG: methyltransferase domain-containing protein [Blautia faecis]
MGRHSLELAKRNIKVVGIDYIPENVSLAIQKAEELSLRNLKFLEADCRYFKNRRKLHIYFACMMLLGTFASR